MILLQNIMLYGLGIGIFAVILTACATLIFTGCESPLNRDAAGTGTATLDIGGPLARATIEPDTALASFDRFELVFEWTGIGSRANVEKTWIQTDLAGDRGVTLTGGSWSLTVSAYLAAGDEYPAAQSLPQDVDVASGGNTPVDVALFPITGPDAEAGIFAWNATLEASLTSATMTVYHAEGGQIEGSPVDLGNDGEGHLSLTPGVYAVYVILAGPAGAAVIGPKTLHVYQSLTSEFAATFGTGDLGAAILDAALARILGAWSETKGWNFTEAPTLVASDFAALGIQGVTAGNLSVLTALFNYHTVAALANAEGLKPLVDAALIGTANKAGYFDDIEDAEEAIAAILAATANGTITAVDIELEYGTATVAVGEYTVTVVFPMLLPPDDCDGDHAWRREGGRHLFPAGGDGASIALKNTFSHAIFSP